MKLPAARAALVVCGLLTGLGLAHAAHAQSCDQALVVDQWQPFVALAGGPPAAPALARLASVISVERLIDTHAAPDAKATALRKKLWDSVRDFDLSALYKAFPESDPPWREARFFSHASGQNYVISVADGATPALGALGDTLSSLRAQPSHNADSGDGFILGAAIESNVGPIGWDGARRAFGEGLLRAAAPAAISAPAAAQQAVAAAFPMLDAADKPLMAQLWYGLPATWRWVAGIAGVSSLTGAGTPPTGLHHLHFSASLDQAGLARAYPGVASYMHKLGNLVHAQIDVTSAAGRWLRYTVDSGARRITIDAWINDQGHLVPTVNSEPVPAAALGDDPSRGTFETRMDAAMRAYGLTVHIDDFVVHWRFKRDAAKASFVGRINQVPKTKITGRAFGIIPSGMLNALMPSTMASFANRFMKRLVESDHGRGARIAMSLSNQADDNRLHFDGQGDLLDNFFVRFGVRMMNGRVLPDARQLASIRQMLDDGLAAFATDRDRRAAITDVDASCKTR